jgi:hypothetical protein
MAMPARLGKKPSAAGRPRKALFRLTLNHADFIVKQSQGHEGRKG